MRRRGGAALWLAALAAQAQDEPATLPPLEVTAPSALPATLAQLPASSTQVEGGVLRDAQYQVNLSEALPRVPGLVLNNRHNYAQDLQLSLRGFGARASFGVRGIRLYTDGIPATMPDGQGQVSHFDLASAERVTVLRGPFSALYGASSGGVIELTTREPSGTSAGVGAWSASHDSARAAADGAWRGEAWSALASASHFDTTGFRRHSAATRAGAHARLAGRPAGEAVLLANVMDLEAQDPLGLTRAEWEQDPERAAPNALVFDTRKTVRQAQAGLAWSTPAGGRQHGRAVGWVGTRDTLQVLGIPDTAQGTVDTRPAHPGGVIDLERTYYGTDGRWVLRVADANLTLGVNVEVLDEHRRGLQNFTGTPGPDSTKGVIGPLRRDEDNRVLGYDPYLQLDTPLGGGWSALAGVRRANVRFTSDDRFIVAGNGDDSGAVRYAAWLPVAGLRFGNDAGAVHLAVSRGAETPTLNELAYRPDGSAGLNTDLRPSRSHNVELGLRVGAPRRPRVNLSVFHIDTRDEIVVASNVDGRASFRNATRTGRRGVELGMDWDGPAGLGFAGAYGFIDARYDEPFCATPCVTPVPPGARLPGVPRHSLFGEVAWRPAPWPATLALEGLYRSDVSVDDAGTDRAPAYAVWNLRLSAALPHGLEAFVRVDNLLDRSYVGSVIVNAANGRYFEPAPGLGFGAGLRWSLFGK